MNITSTDRAVRGTNEDAQISKASCVRLGYFKDAYLHYFVKNETKRAPIINRGYYARTAALKALIQQFLTLCGEEQPKQILSLGAGYDTTWFHLKASREKALQYFEVDFPEVVRTKMRMIAAAPELMEMIGPESKRTNDSSSIVTEEYVLLPGDLRDAELVLEKLQETGLQADVPCLILAECVLVYMPPEGSQALVSKLGKLCSTAAFVIYEQIKPYDPFGKQMMMNLERRGCPLIGIHGSSNLDAQMNRFTNHNWQKAWAEDMETVYYSHLDPLDRRRAEKLEIFDELEEWHLIQEHYCIATGINNRAGVLEGFELPAYSEAKPLLPSKGLPNAD